MEKNKKNVPKIRFKGFTEEWEEKALGDVIDLRSGRDYKHLSEGHIPVYGTGGYMLSVNAALSYDENAIGIGRKGTINKPYLLYAPFWTVDTLFYAVPKNNYDLNFVYNIFQQVDWQKKDESTGVPSLSKIAINSIEVYVVKFDEQAQIGNYFQNIDKLIEAKQSRIDTLKNIKKACLEKMFPKKGATTPEIRFKGFSGEWEEKDIKDIGCVVTGTTPSKSEPVYWDGDFIWVTAQDMKNKYINDSILKLTNTGKLKARGIPANSILVTCIASIGLNAINNQQCATNQQINSIICNIDYYHEYIYYAIESRIELLKNLAGQTAVPIINKSTFESFAIISPTSKSEQKMIGNYFQNLDNLITKNEQQLTKLKNIKKACLEKMFVNKEDAL